MLIVAVIVTIFEITLNPTHGKLGTGGNKFEKVA